MTVTATPGTRRCSARDQLVAVHHDSLAVDGEHAVAVAVEGEARVIAALAHALRQPLDVRGTAFRVDVAAVGLGRDHVDVGAERGEDRRGRLVGGAVGAVEQQPAARQVERGEPLPQRGQVVVERPLEAMDTARARGRGRLLEHALDLVLRRVAELEAVAAEELDPVVAVRVVRRREHDAEVDRLTADEQRRARRGQDAADQRHAPGGGDPGPHRGLEHLARLPCVADDEHARRLARGLGDAAGRGARQRERQLRGDQLARDTADAVGAEQLAAAGRRGRHRH
jgi:hypothetical protein